MAAEISQTAIGRSSATAPRGGSHAGGDVSSASRAGAHVLGVEVEPLLC